MTSDADRVTTVTFDSYSTLVDVTAAEAALRERVAKPESVSRLRRSRSIMDTLVANYIDAYQSFYEMNRDALQFALDVHGANVTPEEPAEILAVCHELDVFGDIRGGIERLREAGLDCDVVSSGDPEMQGVRVDRSGTPWKPFDGEPNLTVNSMHELADTLGSQG